MVSDAGERQFLVCEEEERKIEVRRVKREREEERD